MGGEVRMDAALLPACSSGCRSIETGFRQGVLMLNDADLCTFNQWFMRRIPTSRYERTVSCVGMAPFVTLNGTSSVLKKNV